MARGGALKSISPGIVAPWEQGSPYAAMFWRAAIFELSGAALIAVSPQLFDIPLYAPIHPALGVVALLLFAGGSVSLAALAGFVPQRRLPLVMLAVMPGLAAFALNFASVGAVSGVIAYTLESLGFLASAWWLRRGRRVTLRVYVHMVAAITLALGISMIVYPAAYANRATYGALSEFLIVVAPLFVLGGAGLLAAEITSARRDAANDRLVLTFASVVAVDLGMLVVAFASAGAWTGVVSYGVMATVLVLGAPRSAGARDSIVIFAALASLASLADVVAATITTFGGPEIAPTWSLARPGVALGLAVVAAGFALTFTGTVRMMRLQISLAVVGLLSGGAGALAWLGSTPTAAREALLGRSSDSTLDQTSDAYPFFVAALALVLLLSLWRPRSRMVAHGFVLFGATLSGVTALNVLAYLIGSPFLLDIFGPLALRQHAAIALGVLALSLLIAGSIRLLSASIPDRLVGAFAALAVLMLLRGYVADAAVAHLFVDTADVFERGYYQAVDQARTLTLVLLLGIATSTIVLLARTVTMPLAEVLAAVTRARRGEPRAHAHVTGDDEIAMLAQSFNRMTDELAERAELIEAVRRAQSDLGEAIVILDGGVPVEWNDALATIAGYTPQALRAMPSIVDLWPPSRRDDLAALLRDRTGETYRLETNIQRRNGETADLELAVIPLPGPMSRKQLAIVRDITDAKRSQRDLERLALHDSLTGLPNRALFADRLARTIAAATRTHDSFALLYLDLDRFKEVNDGFGHEAGDHLLRDLAERLARPLGASDTLARFGGDEFCVLLPKARTAAEATSTAHVLGGVLERAFSVRGHSVFVEASVGIVVFPEHGTDADTLLRHADVAMYDAKRARAGVRAYDAGRDPQSQHRLDLLSGLRHAIEREELVVHYQPQIRLDDATCCGSLEALVRWSRDGKVIAPVEFIPLAEETGYINDLTAWVLRSACTQVARLRATGVDPALAVNLSTRNLHHPGIVDLVARTLRESALEPEALTLEITETAVMSDPERAIAAVTRLSGLGVRISIDDFGTGYSSMADLRRLPVDELKIDRTFVMDMLANPSSAAIVTSTIQLAHALGLTVVAEGVEDAATLAALAARGCDLAQGYHLGRPMPYDALLSWIARWRSTLRRSPGHAIASREKVTFGP